MFELDLKNCGRCESVGYLINLGFGGAVWDPAPAGDFQTARKKSSEPTKIGIICIISNP